MDLTCLAAGCWGGIHWQWGGTRVEDLAEVGCSAEVDGEGYFQEIESGEV